MKAEKSVVSWRPDVDADNIKRKKKKKKRKKKEIFRSQKGDK